MITALFLLVSLWIACFGLVARFFGPIFLALPTGELHALLVAFFGVIIHAIIYLRRKKQSYDIER